MSYTSEAQELQFVDEVDVFSAAEFTTGRLPGDSPVQIEFKIVSAGGFSTVIDAESQLAWPDALTHAITTLPGAGYVEFLTDVRLEGWIYIDAFGYQWSDRVWSDGLYLLDEAMFDSLLLGGGVPGTVALESDGTGIDTIRYSLAIFTGVSLELSLDVFPRAEGTLTGLRIDTVYADEPFDIAASLVLPDQTAVLAVPDANPGAVDLVSTWVGRLNSALQVVFMPTIGLGTPVGSIDIAQFEVPVDLVRYDQDRAVPIAYTHPLPSLFVGVADHSFGDVDVGTIADLQVALQSVGQMPVEGSVRIEGGDGAFTVFPAQFYAEPGEEDGVVVTYAPIAGGSDGALLIIDSNDPVRPYLEIPLGGDGAEDTDVGLDTISAEVKGCGCDMNAATGAPWLIGLVALIARRRAQRWA